MNLLKLEDLYKQRVLLYMFKADYFSTNATIHNYPTRNSNNIVIPLFNRARTQCTIFYTGIILWNSLPENTKSIRGEKTFKGTIKTMLLDEY